jgi:hypothetical protein
MHRCSGVANTASLSRQPVSPAANALELRVRGLATSVKAALDRLARDRLAEQLLDFGIDLSQS